MTTSTIYQVTFPAAGEYQFTMPIGFSSNVHVELWGAGGGGGSGAGAAGGQSRVAARVVRSGASGARERGQLRLVRRVSAGRLGLPLAVRRLLPDRG